MPLNFEYEEDRKYFESIFEDIGGLDLFEDLFDFHQPDMKRKQFNRIRNSMFDELLLRFGRGCQLKEHVDCTSYATVVDHLIPLSSNRLNKDIRGIKAGGGKKAPTQSFGSNHISNMVLACSRCNAYKQNKIPNAKLLAKIYFMREKYINQ